MLLPLPVFTIENAGPELVRTDYWATEHAQIGLLYLSGNAGALRLLVPESAEGLLADMGTGKEVLIEESVRLPGECLDVVFNDGSAEPFFASIDIKQVDRRLTASRLRLTVWTERGKVLDLPCVVNV